MKRSTQWFMVLATNAALGLTAIASPTSSSPAASTHFSPSVRHERADAQHKGKKSGSKKHAGGKKHKHHKKHHHKKK